MPQHSAYSSSYDVHPKEEPRTINFESPPMIRLEEDDSYSPPSAPALASMTEIVALHPHSPPEAIAQSSSSPSSRDSGSEALEEKESATEPERERSASVASNKSEEKVEKRKRSRVTPEQLQHLERFFLLDRSPTAARRREISDLLGMQERQTQIWFQNRRAKAKLLDGRQQNRRVSVDLPLPESPPRLSAGFQVDLHNLIHEDDTVTIIPCTDLTIGSWRRIATTVAKHDLVAYVSENKRCLVWFIHSVGFGFKMEIPYESIVETKFTNAAPGSGLASFFLSEPPIFYLENVVPSSVDGVPSRQWKRCADWTEGQQATRVLRHDLIGSAPQLSHLLRNLHTHTPQPATELPLRPPTYRTDQPISPVTPMELPPPPMANLAPGPAFRYQPHDVVESPTPHYSRLEKRPSFPGSPSPDSPYSNGSDRPPPYSAPSAVSASFAQQQSNPHQYYRQSSSSFGAGTDRGSAYTSYSPVDTTHHAATHHSHPVDNFSEIPISHGLIPRPYSAQSSSRPFYNETPRVLQPYQTQEVELRMRRVSTPSSVTSIHSATSHEHLIPPHVNPHHQQSYIIQHSPSPPLLTTPYHPPSHLLNQSGHTDHIGTVPSPLNSSYTADGYD
ncbi:hypothetical protein H0H87_007755 [Tephrocybe sp. NHM501043]|nr:hypothetical protein H0H87_007755 [Tephrocybe sp. NHM501043]